MEFDDVRERLDDERTRLEQVEAELAEVDRALQRLDDGTYGTCESCGSRIDDDLLASVPTARFCATHATTTERTV